MKNFEPLSGKLHKGHGESAVETNESRWKHTVVEVQLLPQIDVASPLGRRIFPPGPLFFDRVILDSSRLLDILPKIEIEELGIGEDSKTVFQIVFLLFCRDIVGGRDGV